jgi:hypothetical protein
MILEPIPYEPREYKIIVKPAVYHEGVKAAERKEPGFWVTDGQLFFMGFTVYSHPLGAGMINLPEQNNTNLDKE